MKESIGSGSFIIHLSSQHTLNITIQAIAIKRMKEIFLTVSENLETLARIYEFPQRDKLSDSDTLLQDNQSTCIAKNGADTSRKALVIWGHGLNSGFSNEDSEKIWNFWDTMETELENKSLDVDVWRYFARGHGSASAATSPLQCSWRQLGLDMLFVAEKALRNAIVSNHCPLNLVLGGSSMGAASALHAIVAMKECADELHCNTLEGCHLAGIILVIPPSCYGERLERSKRLMSAAKRSYNVNLIRKGRTLFPGHVPVETKHNIQPESYENVMCGAAQSNFPSKESIQKALEGVEVLILAWDCDDFVHPVSTADILSNIISHADVRVAQGMTDLQSWPSIINDFIIRTVSKSEKAMSRI